MSEATETDHPHVDAGIEYALDVIEGVIPARTYVHAACQRFIDDLDAAEQGTPPWEFRADLAERCMPFSGVLAHVKGSKASQPITLDPWQAFIVSNLMGWVEKGTEARRFREGIAYVRRGSGKSTMATPLAAEVTFFGGDEGTEGYSCAASRDQAKIVWDAAREMLSRNPRLTSGAGISVRAHSIIQPKTASKFVAMSSDTTAMDGLNVSCAVLDEIASHPTLHVFDSILTAGAKRTSSLMLCQHGHG